MYVSIHQEQGHVALTLTLDSHHHFPCAAHRLRHHRPARDMDRNVPECQDGFFRKQVRRTPLIVNTLPTRWYVVFSIIHHGDLDTHGIDDGNRNHILHVRSRITAGPRLSDACRSVLLTMNTLHLAFSTSSVSPSDLLLSVTVF